MRTIKFRGKASHNGEWLYGDLINIHGEYHILGEDDMMEDGHHVTQDSDRPTWVEPDTIGQFTGLYDKNGKEIYEGDIVEFYHLKTYCINPDCDVHLLGYGTRLIKAVEVVEFKDGVFGVEDDYFGIFSSLDCGLLDEEDYKEEISDPYFDANGYDVENIEALIGLRVIGNIHDNKLLEHEKD